MNSLLRQSNRKLMIAGNCEEVFRPYNDGPLIVVDRSNVLSGG